MKKLIAVFSILIFVALIGLGFYKFKIKVIKPSNSKTDKTQTNNSESKQTNFNKSAHSLTDPQSMWVIVNKKLTIPIDFSPNLITPDVELRLKSQEQQMQINTTTAPAIKEMFLAAKQDNVFLVFGSGYRSGALQKQFYDNYVSKDGITAADTYSARPGHSEHQTGFSADITSKRNECHLETCFSETPEGQWLAANAYKYGFIIRYPKDKQTITGYQYEPWHVRFVGKELASEIHKTNLTLEEFFELGPAMSYD